MHLVWILHSPGSPREKDQDILTKHLGGGNYILQIAGVTFIKTEWLTDSLCKGSPQDVTSYTKRSTLRILAESQRLHYKFPHNPFYCIETLYFVVFFPSLVDSSLKTD